MRASVIGQPCSSSACLPPERVSAEFSLIVAGQEPGGGIEKDIDAG
jgi:hypothetical protein